MSRDARNSEPELSTAAREALRELQQDLASQVVASARARARLARQDQPISATELLQAWEDVTGGSDRRDRRDRLEVPYVLFGVLVAIGSMLVLLLLTSG